MEWLTAWRIVDKVPGWLDEPEAKLLFDSVKEVPVDADIAEVGTAHGKSGTVILLAGREFSTVDTEPQISFLPGANIMTGKSTKMAERFGLEKLGLLFIDASHEYQDVKDDISAWFSRVRVGGTILFHDYQSWPGVTKAVDEAIASGLIEKVSQERSMLKTKRRELPAL